MRLYMTCQRFLGSLPKLHALPEQLLLMYKRIGHRQFDEDLTPRAQSILASSLFHAVQYVRELASGFAVDEDLANFKPELVWVETAWPAHCVESSNEGTAKQCRRAALNTCGLASSRRATCLFPTESAARRPVQVPIEARRGRTPPHDPCRRCSGHRCEER